MTELATPAWMQSLRDAPVEYWHATVMNGGLIASVVVVQPTEGVWIARSHLRDRSLRPVGEKRVCGPFSTHDAAFQAGQAEASRLHKAMVGTREVAETNPDTWREPPGGYQSQALRHYALAQNRAQATRVAAPPARLELEAESIA